MSVDYYSCEWCGESIYEENCQTRSIGEEELYVCDWCLNEHIDNGLLIVLTDDDDEFDSYAPEIKKKIQYFGSHCQWTTSGIETELNNIEENIKNLLSRKTELTNKLLELKRV